jgi:hypothetical protein
VASLERQRIKERGVLDGLARRQNPRQNQRTSDLQSGQDRRFQLAATRDIADANAFLPRCAQAPGRLVNKLPQVRWSPRGVQRAIQARAAMVVDGRLNAAAINLTAWTPAVFLLP